MIKSDFCVFNNLLILMLPGIMFREVELLVIAVLSSEVALLAEGTEFGSVKTRVESTTTDPLLR